MDNVSTTTNRKVETRAVARVFDTWNAASRAIDQLRAASFRDDEIGIVSLESQRHTKQANNTTVKDESVGSGAAKGAAVGGALGILAALASLAIPGVGPIVAGGILGTSLSAAAATTVAGAGIGAAAGGLFGAITELGISDDDARWYEEGVRKGGTLVTVHSNRSDEAVRVMEQEGGRTRSL